MRGVPCRAVPSFRHYLPGVPPSNHDGKMTTRQKREICTCSFAVLAEEPSTYSTDRRTMHKPCSAIQLSMVLTGVYSQDELTGLAWIRILSTRTRSRQQLLHLPRVTSTGSKFRPFVKLAPLDPRSWSNAGSISDAAHNAGIACRPRGFRAPDSGRFMQCAVSEWAVG